MESTSASDSLFESFYSGLKKTEAEDSVLTSDQQIARLLKPGASYLNLNPFEVLQLDPDSSPEEIKKQFRKLSILVHPDKNPDDRDRAQQAFDIMNKAFKTVENPEGLAKIKEIIEEGRGRAEQAVNEKRRLAKKAGRESIDEDDPEKMKRFVYVTTVKVFIDKARKRKEMEDRAAEERKRKREEEILEAERKKLEAEYAKNFEASREDRMSSWKNFTKGGKSNKHDDDDEDGGRSEPKKKKKPIGLGFKPPKLKPEQRL